jgi:hypothetical protein
MQIVPPFGYREVVPFQKSHRVRLPGVGEMPEFVRRGNAMPISHAEFLLVARDYPIVFATNDQGKTFAAVAVLGMSAAENLFFSEAGWAGRVYVPAYVRRYPFCMTRITVDGQEQPERVACVEKRAINDKGEALHNAKGEALPAWEERKKLLFEYEADLVRSDEMSRALAALDLLETFSMQAIPNEGAPLSMTGMYRIAEQKLAALAPEKLKELTQQGFLARVYAHLISLNNFGRLLDRRSGLAKPAAGGVPARNPKKLN